MQSDQQFQKFKPANSPYLQPQFQHQQENKEFFDDNYDSGAYYKEDK